MSCVKYCTFQHLISHHCLVNIECHGGRIYVCVILDHHILQVDVKHFYQHLLDLLLLQRNNIYINILVILINILLIYRVSRNKWIKWDTPFLGHLLTQQAVLLRGDRVLRRIWFFEKKFCNFFLVRVRTRYKLSLVFRLSPVCSKFKFMVSGGNFQKSNPPQYPITT